MATSPRGPGQDIESERAAGLAPAVADRGRGPASGLSWDRDRAFHVAWAESSDAGWTRDGCVRPLRHLFVAPILWRVVGWGGVRRGLRRGVLGRKRSSESPFIPTPLPIHPKAPRPLAPCTRIAAVDVRRCPRRLSARGRGAGDDNSGRARPRPSSPAREAPDSSSAGSI